jgi:glycosidase
VDGAYAPDRINVAAQRRAPDSLLAFLTRLIHRRRETPELGWGASRLIENEPPALFAHRCDWQNSTVLAVHNLSNERLAADLELGRDVEAVDDLLELRDHHLDRGRLHVQLGPYGYLWLRAHRR